MGAVVDYQRDSVCNPYELPVAHVAERLCSWADRVRVLSVLEGQGLWARINETLVKTVRVQAGRDPQPSAVNIDSQSVKTSKGSEQRGVDVHKQTSGCKRHIITDTLGLLLMVLVHSASIQDGVPNVAEVVR